MDKFHEIKENAEEMIANTTKKVKKAAKKALKKK